MLKAFAQLLDVELSDAGAPILPRPSQENVKPSRESWCPATSTLSNNTANRALGKSGHYDEQPPELTARTGPRP
jgi:hypothetical protein